MDYNLLTSDQHRETHSALEAVADATLLVDNHAHPFWLPHTNGTYTMPRLAQVLTEAHPSTQSTLSSRATLSFCRSLRDLHGLVLPDSHQHSVTSWRGSSSSDGDHESLLNQSSQYSHHESFSYSLDTPADMEKAVEDVRAQMGPWDLAKRCFAAAGIAAVLIDDGLPNPIDTVPVQLNDFPTKLNVQVAKRVLRLETEAEDTIVDLIINNENNLWNRFSKNHSLEGPDKRPKTIIRAQQFKAAFRKRLYPLPENVVSFKSISAYRSGLDINLNWTDEDLETALATMSFPTWNRIRGHDRPIVRITDTILVDCIVKAGLEAARVHNIPVQFHCGFGDNDLDLTTANPLLLRPVFTAYPDVKIVLLHAAWPYTRDAAYLTSVYTGVYLDLGLAIPLLSARGMFRAVDEALEIAPITKLLYSSDAHSVPDAFYLAARCGRRVISSVIAASVVSGDLGPDEAKEAIRKILAENAIRLYRLQISYS